MMKKKIIVHNGNLGIGGQEKMLIQFLNVLSPEKYDVLLLIEENKGDENIYLEEIPKWVKYKFLTSKKFMEQLEKYRMSNTVYGKLLYSIYLNLKKKIALKNLTKYLSYADIIIDYDMGLLRNLHKLDLNKKLLVGWSHAGKGELPRKKQKRINIERYNYIVAINEEMKNGYEKNVKNPKIIKIYNFMNFEKIASKSQEPLLENYGSYIVNVGSLTENKNQELLIRAFFNLKKKYKIKEKLLLIGEGKEKNKLQMLINELSMEKDIFLLGQKTNPYNYIKNSLLYVISSKNEGLPLTCIEALALGKMVVATKTSGTDEILDSSKYGKIIEENSVESLEQDLYYYLQNDKDRKEYEIKSLERAEDFNQKKVKKVIERFIDIL